MALMNDIAITSLFVALSYASLNILYRMARLATGRRFGGGLGQFLFVFLVVASVVCGNIMKRVMM